MPDEKFASRAQAPLRLKTKERLVTLLEYVRWEANRDGKYEYHNGKIVKMPYARGPHNEITINTATAIKNAIRPLEIKYRIFSGDQKSTCPN